MAFTPARLSAALEEGLATIDEPASGLCVALSGGLDSSVLLAALVRRGCLRSLPLRAIHVDHGLHADSAQWAERCAALAASLAVPYEQATVDARHRHGESPEAAARVARYAAIAARMRSGDVLVTAHHADDQLETILLQWLRGGGLRAIAGMPVIARFASGWHARPMLGFTREELLAWATGERLAWLTDSSNLDPRFDRNFLRLEVLPRIRSRWPAAARTAGRVAAQAAEALDLEAEVAGADLGLVEEGSALSLERLDLLPPARQRWVLRAWLRGLRLPVPSAATLESLRHDMAVSATDRVPCTNWPGARVYRYRGRLHAVAEDSVCAHLPQGDWAPGDAFELGVLGRLRLEPAVGVGLSRARLPQVLRVLSRADGEHFHPAGGRTRRPLRKWLQERGVLPWRRAQVPLVIAGGELVAVGDIAYGGACAAAPGEPSWKVVWSGRPPLTEQEALEVKRRE